MPSKEHKITGDTIPYTTAENHIMYRGPRMVKKDVRKPSVDATEEHGADNLGTIPQRRFSITGMLFGNRSLRTERQTSISSETGSEASTSPDGRISVMESSEFKNFVHRQSKMLDDFST